MSQKVNKEYYVACAHLIALLKKRFLLYLVIYTG